MTLRPSFTSPTTFSRWKMDWVRMTHPLFLAAAQRFDSVQFGEFVATASGIGRRNPTEIGIQLLRHFVTWKQFLHLFVATLAPPITPFFVSPTMLPKVDTNCKALNAFLSCSPIDSSVYLKKSKWANELHRVKRSTIANNNKYPGKELLIERKRSGKHRKRQHKML